MGKLPTESLQGLAKASAGHRAGGAPGGAEPFSLFRRVWMELSPRRTNREACFWFWCGVHGRKSGDPVPRSGEIDHLPKSFLGEMAFPTLIEQNHRPCRATLLLTSFDRAWRCLFWEAVSNVCFWFAVHEDNCTVYHSARGV